MPIRSDTLDSWDFDEDGQEHYESGSDHEPPEWEFGPMNDEDYDEFDQEHDEVDVYYADEDW